MTHVVVASISKTRFVFQNYLMCFWLARQTKWGGNERKSELGGESRHLDPNTKVMIEVSVETSEGKTNKEKAEAN